jgi:hypothetical protein
MGTVAPTGVCTGTEAIFVQWDIDNGLVTGNAPAPYLNNKGSCYECLVSHSCIDDDVNFDTGHECEDATGNVAGGAKMGETNVQACLDTLTCVLGNPATTSTPTSCANTGATGSGIANCYCGPAEPSVTSCNMASATDVNGTCSEVEVDGVGLPDTTAPSMVIPLLLNTANGSGKANEILNCAGTNLVTAKCGMCFQ